MQNWFTPTLLEDIFHLAGFEEVRRFSGVLCPFAIPIIAPFFNRILAQLPLMHHLCLIQATVFRPLREVVKEQPSVSVIIPCKNERDNIEAAVARMPRMGEDMEIIFCDDHSDDGTGDRIREVIEAYPQWDIRLVQGPGICKAENVWTGFDAAQNDILMILDGDLAVAPEELTKFYDAIASNKGEFINGTRMIYPMRSQAMRLFNLFGNKMFSLLFSFILRQPISDTLCGTKVLWRTDYLKIKKLRGSWGVSDRWGDYEIIFGCARLQLHYVEVPVHYLERTYGITKMNKRLHNAWIMLKMSLAAMKHFRFV